MLVYREQKQLAPVSALLSSVRAESAETTSHDDIVARLIDFGVLESGIADALSPDRDTTNATLIALRRASLFLGHALYHSWNRSGETLAWIERFRLSLDELDILHLPATITIGVPEGYAHYALYPETYLQAAREFWSEQHPERVVVIGIRSIGTSLSGAVGAALEEQGCVIHTYTVRPRGHPFDRGLVTAPELELAWRDLADAHFVVVDEGPGLSGSSFASVADKLSTLGIPDERIVFFPSWQPDASRFVSDRARAQWQRHRKYMASTETRFFEKNGFLSTPLYEISAGQWRAQFYGDERDYPAVQPQHERIKYLTTCHSERSEESRMARTRFFVAKPAPQNGRECLLKFAGLGRFGQAQLARAEQLADAGFAPRVYGLSHGFLTIEWLHGQPIAVGNMGRALLDTVAEYLGYLQRNFPTAPGASFDDLAQMVQVNVAEGLDLELESLERYRGLVEDADATALDARMFPHEWLAVDGRYLKTDGLEHHDDHFYPGGQNIAWDIASTCIEFQLDAPARAYLIEKYRRLTGDRDIATRLPFYSLAYLAFRLGYATMAADALGQSPDGIRFRAQAQRHAELLRIASARFC